MKLRAFVVMPFGPVEVESDKHDPSIRVDFNRVYTELLEPALKEADCESFRADSQISAGDIRTDMFFELVTADLVVADLSIPNPNVYYELGIRDGVCARGVFIVDGGWNASRPFDVASDRSFHYPGRLFCADHDSTSEDNRKKISDAVLALAKVFTLALDAESQGTGSPLYAHLPGLRQVDWENIETSKARYFGTLQRDWEERVRTAQKLHRPGNIITLAQDAPTRLHRSRILSQAAHSLIGLCLFGAAEDVLREILQLTPDDLEANLQLGLVLANSGDIQRSENQMRHTLNVCDVNSTAGIVLGYVYRVLWYLQWKNEQNKRGSARNSSRLLLSAIRSFHDMQRRHPEQYLAGYNALVLLAIVADLFPGVEPQPPLVDTKELTVVVRYTATAAREKAEVTGDYETQFWSAVALSGLEILDNNKKAALQGIEDACAIPSATLFHLRSLHERLVMLQEIGFKPEIVSEAKSIVEATLWSKRAPDPWRKIVVFQGLPVDEPQQSAARFPSSSVKRVHEKILECLENWEIGEGDLAICAGRTQGDVMFGEKCLERGARLRLMMVDWRERELAEVFRDAGSRQWMSRGDALRKHARTEVWYHRSELGDPVEPTDIHGRNKRWIVNTARMEAENATKETRLYGLIIWDGKLRVTDPDNSSFFVAQISRANRYKGEVVPINPLQLLGDDLQQPETQDRPAP